MHYSGAKGSSSQCLAFVDDCPEDRYRDRRHFHRSRFLPVPRGIDACVLEANVRLRSALHDFLPAEPSALAPQKMDSEFCGLLVRVQVQGTRRDAAAGHGNLRVCFRAIALETTDS